MNEAEWAQSVAALVKTYVASEFTKQATLVADAIAPLVQRIVELEQQLKAIPAGPPGPQGERGERGENGDPGERGERGEKGDPGERGEAGERGFDGAPGQKGDAGPQGERGEVGPAGDRGPVGPAGERGMDGLAGRDGRDGLPGAPGAPGEKGLDGINGKDGKDGIDGKDGLGFDDLSVEFDGQRKLTLKFSRGDQVKEFPIKAPWPLYRGVYKAGDLYETGDSATWGGSLWVAQKDDPGKPGDGDGWKLAVKCGRDGRDGKNGEKGEKGDPGPRGHDLTQRDFDGKTRW